MQQMDNFIKENNVEKNIVPNGEVLKCNVLEMCFFWLLLNNKFHQSDNSNPINLMQPNSCKCQYL